MLNVPRGGIGQAAAYGKREKNSAAELHEILSLVSVSISYCIL